jgi:hypothetical protein
MAGRLLHLEKEFPGMMPGNYEQWSDPTDSYNCIAFAEGDTTRVWDFIGGYWHAGAIKDHAFWALESLYYCTGGYRRCGMDGSLEAGFEKIAIYADRFDYWKHAAHQLPDGSWESKCGEDEDISHTDPEVLEGSDYGKVVLYLKRPIRRASE